MSRCREGYEYYRDRDRQRWRRFGKAVREAEVSQGGLCAICKQPNKRDKRGKRKDLAVDHCHRTGRFRGLLCNCCNLGLGHFRHDPDLLYAAYSYLNPPVDEEADNAK
jgi:hypothetical protein